MLVLRSVIRLLVLLLFVVIGLLSWWMLRAKERKLMRLTRQLRDCPTEATVKDYIAVVRKMKIPSKEAMFWGHLREAYEAVLKSTVNESTKQEFRWCLQQKGATWAR